MSDDADGVPEQTCQATTTSGDSCNNVADDDGYCWLHGPEDDPTVDTAADGEADSDADAEATDEGEDEAEESADTTATVATAESEDAVDFSDVSGFITVKNPDEEGKKAALLHWQPGEEKVVRPGIRIKRAIERGRLEYLGPHET